jgi:hypothetical protein
MAGDFRYCWNVGESLHALFIPAFENFLNFLWGRHVKGTVDLQVLTDILDTGHRLEPFEVFGIVEVVDSRLFVWTAFQFCRQHVADMLISKVEMFVNHVHRMSLGM